MGLWNYIKPRRASQAVIDGVPSLAPPPGVAETAPSIESNNASLMVGDARMDIILSYLFQKQCTSMWIQDTYGAAEGVILKRSDNTYATLPATLQDSMFHRAIAALNAGAAMTVKSRVISTVVDRLSPDEDSVPINDGQRIQVVDDFVNLARARKYQFAAFVRSESLLVVWNNDPAQIIHQIEAIETDLLHVVWSLNNGSTNNSATSSSEKLPLSPGDPAWQVDEEASLTSQHDPRPVRMYYALLVAGSTCLLVTILGMGLQQIILEVLATGNYMSMALIAVMPIVAFFSLFFFNVIIRLFAQVFGPVKQLQENSNLYSAVKSPRLQGSLPHVTIQCPVYKEGLEAVIKPTVRSVMKAISTYELQGGSASIFINDDGLQLIDEEDRAARIQFYQDNNIGWVARPKHDPSGTGFVRRGKFKKASNMNYALDFSNKVEVKLDQTSRHDSWTIADETIAYDLALQGVLEEQPADKPAGWAAGNIRIGDYILIIDSDTRIPSDCLLDAVSEMEISPTVAIIQFACGVMQVSGDFFENGVAYFTRLIYTSIKFGVSAGDVAPFVGHNALLRWSAIQHVSFEEEGREHFWSETTVSEDFEIALRLQIQGYVVRYASYFDDGFKEGVSLTVYDELTRWEKYAYGCSELVFHPFKSWLFRGPFTPLFRSFIGSRVPLASKLSIISYIGTYYAIGYGWIGTIINYIAVGLFTNTLDKWYVNSWNVVFGLIVVFSFASNIALAVQRYRTGEMAFFASLCENFKWCIMFAIYFGGISLHLSQAIMCHMLGIDMQWGATAKEVTRTNFFMEMPKVLRKFKYSMIASLFILVGIAVMATAPFIPWSWNITLFPAIFPIALMAASHLLMPIILNPGLTTFTW